MSTAWQFWSGDIAKRLSEQLETTIESSELVIPPDRKMGDLAFGCFKLAKEKRISPAQLASEIAQAFVTTHTDIRQVTAAGPYVNFTLSIGDAVHRVVRDVEAAGESYASFPLQDQLGVWLFEYANPNTHKEIHVGHLRNFVLGASHVRIARAAGLPIAPISFVNDLGKNVAKCLWQLVVQSGFGVKDFTTQQQVETLLSRIPVESQTGKYLSDVYVAAGVAMEEKPEVTEEVSFVQQQLEARQPVWESLWRTTRRWCLDELNVIFQELNVEVFHQYLESDVLERSLSIVSELERTNVAHVSEGALIIDLEDEKAGVALLRKTDGTHLYLAKDLALAELKQHDYPTLYRSSVMTDVRQSLHFRQLFAILKRMGMKIAYDFVGYEIVTLKDGVMSGRKGNVITYQAFRQMLLDNAREEIMKRHTDWPEGKVSHASWAIAMAGLKFGMLKQDGDKVFTFDIEQALSFEGDTGPYCQYAATRMQSILRKGGSVNTDAALTRDFDHETEKALALVIAMLPSRVMQAAREIRPSIIAQWCIELSQAINAFYRDVAVLDSEPALKEGRLRLVSAARTALERGLWLLCIPLPDEM